MEKELITLISNLCCDELNKEALPEKIVNALNETYLKDAENYFGKKDHKFEDSQYSEHLEISTYLQDEKTGAIVLLNHRKYCREDGKLLNPTVSHTEILVILEGCIYCYKFPRAYFEFYITCHIQNSDMTILDREELVAVEKVNDGVIVKFTDYKYLYANKLITN